MNRNYPFIFAGNGIGKPFGYDFSCYAKFKSEPTEEQKNEIEKSIPSAASETVCWYGSLLYFGDSDFGATLKMEYEPDWYKNVDAEIAGNKDLELWTKPSKVTLEKFHYMFDRWVYALNTAYPLEFFIKENKIAKKDITPWNKWSIEQIIEPAYKFCFDTVVSVVEDEDKRRIHSILVLSLMYYFNLFKPPSLNNDLRHALWKFYESHHDFCESDYYAKIFMSFTKEEILDYLKKYTDSPHENIIYLATSIEARELVLDDDYYEIIKTIFGKLAESDMELVFLFSSNPTYQNYKPHLFTRIEHIKKKDQIYIRPIARLHELALITREAGFQDNDEQNFYDYQYLVDNELFVADGYYLAAALYFLDSDYEKAKDLILRGLKFFGHEQIFVSRAMNMISTVGGDELLVLFEGYN